MEYIALGVMHFVLSMIIVFLWGWYFEEPVTEKESYIINFLLGIALLSAFVLGGYFSMIIHLVIAVIIVLLLCWTASRWVK